MFSKPEDNLKYISVFPGMKVADFGTGSGQYALAIGKLIGTDGRVYAVDVQKDLLDRLKKEADSNGIHNIEVIWGDLDEIGGSKIKDQSIDLAVIANVLFQSENKQNLAMEAKRVLKPGGKLLFVDWKDSFNGLGPHPEHIVTANEAKNIFQEAGFNLEKEFEGGEHHYGLVLIKK